MSEQQKPNFNWIVAGILMGILIGILIGVLFLTLFPAIITQPDHFSDDTIEVIWIQKTGYDTIYVRYTTQEDRKNKFKEISAFLPDNFKDTYEKKEMELRIHKLINWHGDPSLTDSHGKLLL